MGGFEEMRTGCNPNPNVWTFNVLMKMYGDRGKFAEMKRKKRFYF